MRVATARPAACLAAKSKYGIRRARRGPRCKPARTSTNMALRWLSRWARKPCSTSGCWAARPYPRYP
eukprot:1036938-Lingulodinium_polyedra.AAC.1